MDFGFSEQQEMLRTMARDFLAKECPKAKVRELDKDELGYSPKMWSNMAELGWQGLVFPEEYSGTEASFVDLLVLMEEMGRNITPGPFFSTVALCALPLLKFGTKKQKAEYLPDIANGKAIWTFAFTEQSASYKPSELTLSATIEGDDYILNGEKLFVADAHIANYLLVVARTAKSKNPEDGVTFFVVDSKAPGLKIERIPTMAGDRQFQVVFNKVKVPKINILGTLNKGWEIVNFTLQRAAALKCAEISGACQAVLDMTSAYAKERIQFDRPIGTFQAVQHKLADMLIDVEAIQYLLYQAACSIADGEPSQLQISIAKAKASEAYQNICIDGITAHGAIGFTYDHDIGLYYRRVRAAEFAAGNVDMHKEIIAVEMGL
ncbi:MAG: acyl-CoA dehydrogenase [Chloroflexi bacterium]|nr:acyl-CoA dehydrogenase [Chloroflexota bacterium]MBM3172483.1 acyl-CoA dehydrogenase [Chloroflexota bacterium]MBM3175112.1 acyl-CoA dehydrogenase [Chloroflexota bacterium]MBM4450191.1 acyl-CoA dehydrogenase [Chloroflexota bacterium]